MDIVERIRKAAPNEIEVDDLSIDLGNEGDAPNESSIQVDDIPTGEEDQTSPDFDIEDAEPEIPQTPQPVKTNDDEKKIEKTLNKAKELSTKVDITELNLHVKKLKKENDFLYKEISELKQVVHEFLLFRIPKYEEFEIPENRLNPELIFTFVTNALDKRLLRLFNDLPVYNAKKLSILEKDNNNNIVNAIVSVEISFDKHSRFSFLRFDLELIILDGFLNVPGWFMYDNKFYTLNEEGIRKIDLLNQKIDQEFNPEKSKSWYDVNHNQKNPIYPNGVGMTDTNYLPNQNTRSNRRNF